jgi:hypothetical protein
MGAIVLIVVVSLHLVFSQKVFCVESEMTGYSYFFRFLWCFSFASFGLAVIALYWHRQGNLSSAWPKYASSYPLQLLITASLVLGLLHFWERTSGYTFYYLSGSLCFMLGFMVDYHWSFVNRLINWFEKGNKDA